LKPALALIATLAVAGLATPSSAQVLTVAQVSSACPDVSRAQACPPLATQFLTGRRYGPSTDQEVVSLVVAIAEASQQSNVSRRACLNAADGIRILAQGVSTEAQSQQILDIADALCTGRRTASLGNRRVGGLLESLGGGSDGDVLTVASNSGGKGGSNGGDVEDDEDEVETGGGGTGGGGTGDEEDDDCPGNSDCNGGSGDSNASETGLNPPGQDKKDEPVEDDEEETPIAPILGSNDAASDKSTTGSEHANENATDNTSGQNGQQGQQPNDNGKSETKETKEEKSEDKGQKKD
jgi:hypothetical protein